MEEGIQLALGPTDELTHGDTHGREELRSLGGCFQFRLDWNRSGDDYLPIRYASGLLDSAGSVGIAWERVCIWHGTISEHGAGEGLERTTFGVVEYIQSGALIWRWNESI